MVHSSFTLYTNENTWRWKIIPISSEAKMASDGCQHKTYSEEIIGHLKHLCCHLPVIYLPKVDKNLCYPFCFPLLSIVCLILWRFVIVCCLRSRRSTVLDSESDMSRPTCNNGAFVDGGDVDIKRVTFI